MKSLTSLFDALIKPIACYSAQVWFYDTKLVKELVKQVNGGICNISKAANLDKLELMHLRYLKWCLGLHKKANVMATYGDTGRFPLLLTILKQGFGYYRRVESIAAEFEDVLVSLFLTL